MSRANEIFSNAPEVDPESRHAAPEVVVSAPPQQSWWPNTSIAPHDSPGTHDTTYRSYGQQPLADDSPAKTINYNHHSRRIAGLPVWAFWLVIGIVGLVVIGASVGGAVGGSMRSNTHTATLTSPSAIPQPTSNSSAASSLPTSTTSTSSSITTTTTTTLTASTSSSAAASVPSTDCPSSNGQEYTPIAAGGSTSIYTFTKHCGNNISGGDITEAYVQTFNHCIDMCSSWNYYGYVQGADIGECVAVVFRVNGAPPGNCWIKNSTSMYSATDGDVATLDR